jgi:hypothetical protein
MTLYKIRINCTTQRDLTINNKKINQKTFNNFISKSNIDEYISKISILYEDNFHMKDDISFINKTLEFYCNKEITENEFKEFISKLTKLGFVSKKKHPKIQFINNDGNIIYNYNYNTCLSYPKKSIKSIHYHQNLFIKT